MTEADDVVHDRGHPGLVVHADRGDAAAACAMPEGRHRDARVLELLDELGAIAQVAEEEDGVAVPGLEDAPQRHGLVSAPMRVSQDHVVAAPIGFQRCGLDGAGEEGVRDVADDDAQQHRGGAAQASREGVRSVTQSIGGLRDAAARRFGDGHRGRRTAEDARDGRLRDPGGLGDVAHRRRDDDATRGDLAARPG